MTRQRFSVAIGDHVAYSVQFLKSMGLSHSDAAHARGVVREITTLSRDCVLARIQWDRDMPERVNVQNLATVGLNRRFQNID
jgi:hypothetical protein